MGWSENYLSKGGFLELDWGAANADETGEAEIGMTK